MAERGDVTIDWGKSPRIITVDSPSTSLSAQDLLDTLRAAADELDIGDDWEIVRATGKDDLGDGVYTGINETLINAWVAFEARRTATSFGTATSNDAGGATLTDTGATFEDDNVAPGAIVINWDDMSIATVLKVVDQNNLEHEQLKKPNTGGAGTWSIGNNYTVINTARCEITGGNIVAVDLAGDPADATLPTFCTQINLAQASQSTLVEVGTGGGITFAELIAGLAAMK
jgi:hypothetical protein